ncbi:MAG TPA: hypothetical protein VGO11_20020 [Chthoniobacteraceae bacterium]|nr:hypothetical protein [Chthoniobacteraceae bacterium]
MESSVSKSPGSVPEAGGPSKATDLAKYGLGWQLRRMSTQLIEQQLSDLQKRVAALENQVQTSKGTWRDAIGFARNDELFDEAMKLGAEWRARANQEGRS